MGDTDPQAHSGRSYIDLHLHLLPGIDDGPSSEPEALELARVLIDDNIRVAAVTPHFNPWHPSKVESRADVERHLDQFRNVLARSGLDLELRSGAEHFLTPDILNFVRAGTAPYLASEPYMLVELPFNQRPLYTDQVLYDLLAAGVSPVLAHPERYSWVQADPEAVVDMVESGVALQCGAASLNGHYGPRVRKTAETLFSVGMYQLVSTDFHRPQQNRLLSVMEESVISLFGDELAKTVFHENPGRLIAGQPLLMADPTTIHEPKQKRLFGIF
jgi:protein-tyrosine phosphatase